MDEHPLAGAHMPSSGSLSYGSAEWVTCDSRYSLRKHHAQAVEPQPDDGSDDRRPSDKAHSVVASRTSRSSRVFQDDDVTDESSAEWIPRNVSAYEVHSENTASISLLSLEVAGQDRGRSLHDVGSTVGSFQRSDGAILGSKVTHTTRCGSAKALRGETDQVPLRRLSDRNVGVRNNLRACWPDWVQTSYLWYTMMALMAVVLLTAVVAVFVDLRWAAELPEQETFALDDWQEPHHAEARVFSPTRPEPENRSWPALRKAQGSTPRPRKSHKARKSADHHNGGTGLVDGAKTAGGARPVMVVGSGTGTERPEDYGPDDIEKELPPALEQPTSDKCGEALYAFCGLLYKLYHYRPSTNECVFTATEPVRVCNHSPFRFATMDECRRVCVVEGIHDFVEERPEICSRGPLFAPCTWLDVKPTWAIFNGEKCVRWPFPDGLCPARNNSAVFVSRQECADRCLPAAQEKNASYPADPCPIGPGPAEVCRPDVLRFPYFSHHSANECFEASEHFLAHRRCLTAPTMFVNERKCRDKCMRKPRTRR